MHPFPFASQFLVLYQTFTPTTLLPDCWRGEEYAENFRVGCGRADGWGMPAACDQQGAGKPRSSTALLPAGTNFQSVRCSTATSDGSLALRCRSRAYDSLVLAESRQTEQEVLQWECPASPTTGSRNKYSLHPARSCANGLGTWGARIQTHLKCVTVQVAELLQLRPGESVLDWGSGCGWSLTWLSTLYGINGYGIEATSQNFAWATRFSRGNYCLYGGIDLGWIPDESFDAVTSYWVMSSVNSG
ncbi:unnamed protein product [Symbiodinium natans]|uniref:Methyltransferase domain-containing protein n=1 Tax=Symbiodinium natans TaxID=878477 RepID=A0A812LD25_9DINO|nr:unnamed protein product [Symbiodinium natans]